LQRQPRKITTFKKKTGSGLDNGTVLADHLCACPYWAQFMDYIQKTIADLQDKVRKQEEELIQTKRMINGLCAHAGMDAIYPDADLQQRQGVTLGVLRSDLYYGRPLATCVREYLEMRRAANKGAAPLEDIISALETGGYDLPSISADKDGQKRGVAISLAKNNSTFHRLPNGDWGLAAWYPNAREKKPKSEDGSGNGKTEIAASAKPGADALVVADGKNKE
jgi:hypothetical protein